MKLEIDRQDFIALIKGYGIHYSEFDNPLVKKAGHSYRDQYGIHDWDSLEILSDDELYKLYLISKNSWQK